MIGPGYGYGFNGWDEPPFQQHADDVRRNERRISEAAKHRRENAADRVLFELGLVLAVPLALATLVTLVLSATGVSL